MEYLDVALLRKPQQRSETRPIMPTQRPHTRQLPTPPLLHTARREDFDASTLAPQDSSNGFEIRLLAPRATEPRADMVATVTQEARPHTPPPATAAQRQHRRLQALPPPTTQVPPKSNNRTS